ncbi:MAG TPA: hypothetical protein PKB10_00080 [Tepidisphaeraceae bacterium]|nr:hypothetical protein [Tepidisphaeraceae bacterium]
MPGRSSIPIASEFMQQLCDRCNAMQADMLRLRESDQTIAQFGERLAEAYEQSHLLFRLARLLNSVEDPKVVMQAVVGQGRSATPFEWMFVGFAAQEQVIAPFRDACFIDGNLPMPARRIAAHLCQNIVDKGDDDWVRILTPAQHPVAAASGKEILVEAISTDGRTVGVIVAGGKPDPDADIDSGDTQLLDAVATSSVCSIRTSSAFSRSRNCSSEPSTPSPAPSTPRTATPAGTPIASR